MPTKDEYRVLRDKSDRRNKLSVSRGARSKGRSDMYAGVGNLAKYLMGTFPDAPKQTLKIMLQRVNSEIDATGRTPDRVELRRMFADMAS